MHVFITVDTEVWPQGWQVDRQTMRETLDRDIHGKTAQGDCGLPLQLEILRQTGQHATYFVEPLFSMVAGSSYLREITNLVLEGGQEVQLHLHTEWNRYLPQPRPCQNIGDNIADYSEAHQAEFFEVGSQALRACGAHTICAFRAGNYGASNTSLRAMRQHGIYIDSSYNPCYLNGACDIHNDDILRQPTELTSGVVEFPISSFNDLPGHARHAQLCACSFDELSNAMLNAWASGWSSFVIVSHSFELLNAARSGPDPIVIKRFERLCHFLADNADKFVTRPFHQIDPYQLIHSATLPLTSTMWRTGRRMVEQLYRSRMLRRPQNVLPNVS